MYNDGSVGDVLGPIVGDCGFGMPRASGVDGVTGGGIVLAAKCMK